MPRTTEDLRVAKTRAALANALEQLMGEQDFEHITTSEICARAQVSRAAFYTHFHDKYDLMHHVMAAELERLSPLDPGEAFTLFAESMLTRLRENGFVCRRLLIGSLDTEVTAAMEELFIDYTRNCVTAGAWQLRVPSVPSEASIAYCAHGLAGVVMWWVRSGFPTTEAQTARIMQTLLESTFTLGR